MGVLPDWMIQDQVKIEPFAPSEKREGKISYGLTSYGYDARLGYKFKIFTNVYGAVIDPKNFDPKAFVDVDITPPTHNWEPAAEGGWVCTNCDKFCDGELDTEQICNYPGGYPDHITVPPNSFVLAETLEYFEIPRTVLAKVIGKSTYARCGLIVNVTPLEPEWKGKVTVEISNTTTLPAKIYAGEGIMQINFFKGEAECRVSYADKKGRYQNQQGLTLPFSH